MASEQVISLYTRLQEILADDPGEVVRVDFARSRLEFLVNTLKSIAENEGNPDILRRLTPEEAAEVIPISEEAIEAALEKGRKEAEAFSANQVQAFRPG